MTSSFLHGNASWSRRFIYPTFINALYSSLRCVLRVVVGFQLPGKGLYSLPLLPGKQKKCATGAGTPVTLFLFSEKEDKKTPQKKEGT